MHFAGLKAVGESCQQPLMYYHNNVYGTLVLLEAMADAGVKQLVFSSSAAVYGEPLTTQYSEYLLLAPIKPYLSASGQFRPNEAPWKCALLRYFNPIGAHESGLIGEDPNGIPNNLMPYVSQVAIGKFPSN